MKKIHIQCRTSLIKLATVARGMHKAGLYLSRPSDILDVSLDAAQKLFDAKPFNTDEEAEEYLHIAGFSSPFRNERREVLLGFLEKKTNARDELEEMIERVKRGPSTAEEIKEMLKQPIEGVEK